MIDRIYNVLFLCTGNSARSAERHSKSAGGPLTLGAKLRAIGQAEGSTDVRGTAA